MAAYKHTHVSIHDDSAAMMVGEGPGYIVLENEDGRMWTDPAADWRPIETKDSNMPNNIARRAAAIEVALASKASGRNREQTIKSLTDLTDDRTLALEAAQVAYGDEKLDADEVLDNARLIAVTNIGTDRDGPYVEGGYCDEMRGLLADVFAAGVLEGQNSADFAFNDGDTHFSDVPNPFDSKD
jgi:hypothetical protein